MIWLSTGCWSGYYYMSIIISPRSNSFRNSISKPYSSYFFSSFTFFTLTMFLGLDCEFSCDCIYELGFGFLTTFLILFHDITFFLSVSIDVCVLFSSDYCFTIFPLLVGYSASSTLMLALLNLMGPFLGIRFFNWGILIEGCWSGLKLIEDFLKEIWVVDGRGLAVPRPEEPSLGREALRLGMVVLDSLMIESLRKYSSYIARITNCQLLLVASARSLWALWLWAASQQFWFWTHPWVVIEFHQCLDLVNRIAHW